MIRELPEIFIFFVVILKTMEKKIVIGIVGAGAMGAGIAQVTTAAGHHTILTDTNSVMLNQASANHKKIMNSLVEKGKLSQQQASEILSRLVYAESLTALNEAGLVVEAIVENLDSKREVFSKLEAIVSAQCILASNTSSLSIASVASACKNPARVVGIHFFNPAPLMPLVEIIPSLTTQPETTMQAKTLVDSWGKVSVIARDTPGFIVNRIARPFYGEALRIYEEGIADMATIDWAMKEKGGFKMGPFELMDYIGNDINYKVTETVWEQFFYDPRYKPSLTQKRLFEAGLFGKKSGKGYYDYSPGAVKPEPDKNNELAYTIFMRVLVMLINEAAEALYLKIASREDIDLAMTKGVNYPKGLLKWADEIGLKKVLDEIEKLRETYMEDRYRPSVLLKKKVWEESTFW